MATPTATLHDGHRWEYRREFSASAQELWAWVSESAKTAQWFGPFERESDDVVAVTMTAEEPGPPMQVKVTRCEAPNHLVLDTGMWVLELEVGDGFISLFHVVDDAQEAASIGPGWEFYMDRLAAAVAGEAVEAINFEKDYFPMMSEYFTAKY